MRAGWITKLWKQCANARCGKCRKAESPEVVARVLGLDRSTVYAMAGALPARRVWCVEGEALVRPSAETGWPCAEVRSTLTVTQKNPLQMKFRIRAMDA